PDRTSLAWMRLRVPCLPVEALPGGRFGWSDERSGEIVWLTVAESAAGRVYFAEGKFRPGPLLPVIPVKAVAVLWHDLPAGDGRGTVGQRVDLYLQTDSRAAAVLARLVGPAGPRLAEQGAEQLLLFYSGIARYCDRHPERTNELLAAE